MKSARSLSFVALLLLPVKAPCAEHYRFTLDGASVAPHIVQTRDLSTGPGDIAYLHGYVFCLDEPGDYRLESKGDLLRRTWTDGRSAVVAAKVGEKDETASTRIKKDPAIANPLASMQPDELRQLRGVDLDEWPAGMEKQLEQLDLDHACLRIAGNAIKSGMPPIPERTCHLIVQSNGTSELEGWDRLGRLKNLRTLEMRSFDAAEFDFSLLRGKPLEYLGLPDVERPSNTDALADLATLRVFNGSYTDYLGDGSFLGKLIHLRSISAARLTAPDGRKPAGLDLRGLKNLGELQSFDVQGSPVKALPTTAMASLKRASLIFTDAPPDQIDALTKANPQALVERTLNEAMTAALKGVERLRLRTGGVCHRQIEEEKTIRETTSLPEIAKVVEHLAVDDTRRGGHCLCCGDPTFEFYRGDRLVAMFGFHHGRSIRWSGGNWPEDGILLPESAEYLVDWAAASGYTGPKQELTEGRERAAAARRRSERYASLIPPELLAGLRASESSSEWPDLFIKSLPEPATRARLALRLFGCDEGTWALASGLDEGLSEKVIPSFQPGIVRLAIASAKPNTEEAQGAVRWMFGEGHAADFAELGNFEELTRFALAHPRQLNRWRTLAVLRDLKSPKAIALLIDAMQSGTKPRALSKDDIPEPAGSMSYRPGDIDLPAETSDRAAAALCLAMLRVDRVKAEVEGLRNALTAEQRRAWDEAVHEKNGR